MTDLAGDFTKIVPLGELSAETPYYLDVVVNGLPQCAFPYPTFVTHPPLDVSRDFKFVVFTDFVTASKLTRPFQTFRSASQEFPAFVFIGGDFDHRNPATLTEKRQMFKDLYNPETPFMDDFVPMILRRYAIARQWDDHDSGINNSDKTYPDWALTQQAFQEYVPLYALPRVTPGIWQKFSYAQADCFVLDCRSQRDSGLDPDGPDKSMLDGNSLGSTGELEWLKNGLLASTARWKIVFTSVVTNSTTKANDAWGAYTTEWNALKEFVVGNRIDNVVFIAGDLHLAAIDNGSISGFPEMCVPQPNADRTGSCATGMRGFWSEGYYDGTCAGYGLVTVLQNPDRLILQAADEFGQIHLSYTVSAATPSPTPTLTPSPTPTATTTPSPTQTPTPTETPTPSPSPTEPPTPTPTPTSSPTPSPTESPTPTPTPTSTPSPTGTPTPSVSPTPTPVAPAITTQPANKTVNVGQTAKFTVKATGSAPLAYQWRKNAVEIAGATSSSYTTPPAVAADNGSQFSVVVSNPGGSVTSKSRTLTVNPEAVAPSITSQPADKTVSLGATAKFAVTAAGSTPLTYQWMKNGSPIPGATKRTYTTPLVTPADNGSLFAATVTNSVGSVASNSGTLSVK